MSWSPRCGHLRFATGFALATTFVMSAAPARAEATVFRFFDAHTETLTASLEGCLPADLEGTVTVTETSTGQVVETAADVFTVHGVNEFDYRLDLPDGSFVESGLNRDRYAFVANPPLTVFTVAIQDLRTIFDPDGTAVGSLSIHAAFHVTYNDLDGDLSPDPEEIVAELEYFRLRCA